MGTYRSRNGVIPFWEKQFKNSDDLRFFITPSIFGQAVHRAIAPTDIIKLEFPTLSLSAFLPSSPSCQPHSIEGKQVKSMYFEDVEALMGSLKGTIRPEADYKFF